MFSTSRATFLWSSDAIATPECGLGGGNDTNLCVLALAENTRDGKATNASCTPRSETGYSRITGGEA